MSQPASHATPRSLAPTRGIPENSPTPEEEDTRGARDDDGYLRLLAKLSRASVSKHFDAYVDIDWDDPRFRIDPADPRFCIGENNALGETSWYRALPEREQARLGLHMIATLMKNGLQFENVLKRGLLEFTLTLPNRSPEFRYACHEVIEEAQHSLMFQEFVNRSGIDVPGLPRAILAEGRRVAGLGRRFPELFFFFVLGGEDPIDHQQRTYVLAGAQPAHPLVRRVCQLHVMEEARHISFARAYLRNRVPRLPARRQLWLKAWTPVLLGQMARLMMQPSPAMIREFHIPRKVLREAYSNNPKHRGAVQAALGKVASLAGDLGLRNGVWNQPWKLHGLVT
ncbi:MAG: diiron oxygenase [Myxococcales bacterium]|nr:diiron oxygenase [Myxococcales bacterium]MDD9966053.1 diiron oxygenase [Myxococcales bacterium]